MKTQTDPLPGFDREALADVTQILASRDGFCGCEILFLNGANHTVTST